MKSSVMKLGVMVMLAAGIVSYGATVAYWDFEDGVAGQSFTQAGQPSGSGGSEDLVNNVLMRGWNETYGPSFTSTTATGAGLAMRSNHQDGYVYSTGTDDPAQALIDWAPSQFTLETTFMLEGNEAGEIGGWQTLIGRDSRADSTPDSSFSGLYFQKTWDNYFRFDFATAGGERFEVSSVANGLQVQADRWYSMAAVSDGTTLSLYVNDIADGAGWVLAGQTDMSGAVDSAMGAAAGNWTFGRGWYNGGQVDKMNGYLDDVRFSDTALAPGELITVVPEPATMVLLGLGALAGLRRRK